jgi:hypothetical protein
MLRSKRPKKTLAQRTRWSERVANRTALQEADSLALVDPPGPTALGNISPLATPANTAENMHLMRRRTKPKSKITLFSQSSRFKPVRVRASAEQTASPPDVSFGVRSVEVAILSPVGPDTPPTPMHPSPFQNQPTRRSKRIALQHISNGTNSLRLTSARGLGNASPLRSLTPPQDHSTIRTDTWSYPSLPVDEFMQPNAVAVHIPYDELLAEEEYFALQYGSPFNWIDDFLLVDVETGSRANFSDSHEESRHPSLSDEAHPDPILGGIEKVTQTELMFENIDSFSVSSADSIPVQNAPAYNGTNCCIDQQEDNVVRGKYVTDLEIVRLPRSSIAAPTPPRTTPFKDLFAKFNISSGRRPLSNCRSQGSIKSAAQFTQSSEEYIGSLPRTSLSNCFDAENLNPLCDLATSSPEPAACVDTHTFSFSVQADKVHAAAEQISAQPDRPFDEIDDSITTNTQYNVAAAVVQGALQDLERENVQIEQQLRVPLDQTNSTQGSVDVMGEYDFDNDPLFWKEKFALSERERLEIQDCLGTALLLIEKMDLELQLDSEMELYSRAEIGSLKKLVLRCNNDAAQMREEVQSLKLQQLQATRMLMKANIVMARFADTSYTAASKIVSPVDSLMALNEKRAKVRSQEIQIKKLLCGVQSRGYTGRCLDTTSIKQFDDTGETLQKLQNELTVSKANPNEEVVSAMIPSVGYVDNCDENEELKHVQAPPINKQRALSKGLLGALEGQSTSFSVYPSLAPTQKAAKVDIIGELDLTEEDLDKENIVLQDALDGQPPALIVNTFLPKPVTNGSKDDNENAIIRGVKEGVDWLLGNLNLKNHN